MEDFPFPKVDNPLRVLKPPLKKVESEPILKTGSNHFIFLIYFV